MASSYQAKVTENDFLDASRKFLIGHGHREEGRVSYLRGVLR